MLKWNARSSATRGRSSFPFFKPLLLTRHTIGSSSHAKHLFRSWRRWRGSESKWQSQGIYGVFHRLIKHIQHFKSLSPSHQTHSTVSRYYFTRPRLSFAANFETYSSVISVCLFPSSTAMLFSSQLVRCTALLLSTSLLVISRPTIVVPNITAEQADQLEAYFTNKAQQPVRTDVTPAAVQLKGTPCYNCVQSCTDQTKEPPFLTADQYTRDQCKVINGCIESCDRTDIVPAATPLIGTACYNCVQSCFDQTITLPFYTADGYTYAQCKVVNGCSGPCDTGANVTPGALVTGDACYACVQDCFDRTGDFPFYTAEGYTYAQCRSIGGCPGSCAS